MWINGVQRKYHKPLCQNIADKCQPLPDFIVYHYNLYRLVHIGRLHASDTLWKLLHLHADFLADLCASHDNYEADNYNISLTRQENSAPHILSKE